MKKIKYCVLHRTTASIWVVNNGKLYDDIEEAQISVYKRNRDFHTDRYKVGKVEYEETQP